MRLWVILVCALVASACSGPTKTDRWTVERQAPEDTVVRVETTICDDIEALALGAMAGTMDLTALLDELSRVGAVAGATAALPHLADVRAQLSEDHADIATPLMAAAADLDRAGYDECEIPIFTSIYVSTTFATCFTRVGVAAQRLAPEAASCAENVSPDFLPCWDEAAGFVPVDCRSGEGIQLVDHEWVAA